jgi:hypothetical protein
MVTISRATTRRRPVAATPRNMLELVTHAPNLGLPEGAECAIGPQWSPTPPRDPRVRRNAGKVEAGDGTP